MSTKDADKKYWYNDKTGQVEEGYQSLGVDRIGPFDTAEEASHALEIVRRRAEEWREEEQQADEDY